MLDSILILSPIAIAFTILGVSGLANATNIIDGYNGLSAGYAVIASPALPAAPAVDVAGSGSAC